MCVRACVWVGGGGVLWGGGGVLWGGEGGGGLGGGCGRERVGKENRGGWRMLGR